MPLAPSSAACERSTADGKGHLEVGKDRIPLAQGVHHSHESRIALVCNGWRLDLGVSDHRYAEVLIARLSGADTQVRFLLLLCVQQDREGRDENGQREHQQNLALKSRTT